MKNSQIVALLENGSIALPTLLLKNYAKVGLNETEFMFLLHIFAFAKEGNSFPTPDELASYMSCNEKNCTELLSKLIRNNFLLIEEMTELDGTRSEGYSLKPLWEKLVFLMIEEENQSIHNEKKQEETNVYTLFEKEFGRPLSPMEGETLSYWLDEDQHSYSLIKSALREAVLSGKLNFRYIDRILFEWKKNGIKTVEQAKLYSEKFRSAKKPLQQKQAQQEEKVSIPFYNWLES